MRESHPDKYKRECCLLALSRAGCSCVFLCLAGRMWQLAARSRAFLPCRFAWDFQHKLTPCALLLFFFSSQVLNQLSVDVPSPLATWPGVLSLACEALDGTKWERNIQPPLDTCKMTPEEQSWYDDKGSWQ